MNRKRKPHHDLDQIKAKFATVDDLEITATARRTSRDLGFDLDDVFEAIQALEREDFQVSTAAHSPPAPGVWHDAYSMIWDGIEVYIKFAGACIVDITLVSFKERGL